MAIVASTRAVHFEDLFSSETPARIIDNGRCTVLATAAGTGYVASHGIALTRWRGDPLEDSDGVFLYLRDAEDGATWSAGYQPTRKLPDQYTAWLGEDAVCIEREDREIHTRMEVTTALDTPAEMRRLTITNRSDRRRRIEVTSYAEVVLDARADDLAHPAFSKLFIETERVEDRPILLARRRPRGADEAPRWLVHALLGAAGRVTHETDRARFIGRGRTLADPAGLSGALSGTTGCVLDPIVSLRAEAALDPGESVTLLVVLGLAETREEALELATIVEKDAQSFTWAPAGRHDETALGWQPGTIDRPAAVASRYRPLPPETGKRGGPESDDLLFPNGLGGFSADGTEYILRLRPGTDGRLPLPPLPWVNVVANPRAGFVASERGAWNTWAANSREFRLTPWPNDPITDPHGEALYVRDEDACTFWSPTPGPAPAAARYEVRHGFGYSRYLLEAAGIRHDTLVFVPKSDPMKLARLRLTNCTDQRRNLSVFAYAQLVLGGRPEATAPDVRTVILGRAIFATNPAHQVFGRAVAVASMSGPGEIRATTDRGLFIGKYGSVAAPLAVTTAPALPTADGSGAAQCAAFQATVTMEPGETVEVLVLLGAGEDRAEAETMVGRYSSPAAVEAALAGVNAFWRETLGAVQVHTPEPALDVLGNGWLLYQDLSCRMWGRTAFYQSGGAYGYRDQLQDALALLFVRPDMTRDQIVLHAGHQFVDGDVLHWWHPPSERGLRTRFSDDLLWLPYAVASYVDATGDVGVLDTETPFLTAKQLETDDDEVLLHPSRAGEWGTVFEHACRSIDRSLTAGSHGLPLMGSGDWNDGMNRVGREGRGESVWLGFFLYAILNSFIPLCEARGETARAARYAAYCARLHVALNDAGWDGAWYRRAYYDDGTALGSALSEECKIDAIAQAWAVISLAAPPERTESALDALERHLVDEEGGLIRLLTPAFDLSPHDPGYIKGYVPGVRENGGQYTHAALWAIRALAQAGRRDRAERLLKMLSPVVHTDSPEGVERYRAEPYVVAADVYGVQPHVGRGGWTWYTGSAGWMYRVLLESILGLTVEGGSTLVVGPCIPSEWPGFSITYRTPAGGNYSVEVANGGDGRVSSAALDGRVIEVREGRARIPLLSGTHRVAIGLG